MSNPARETTKAANFIVAPDDLILVTGATGFIGPRVVASLLRHGFRNVRAFARPSSNLTALEAVSADHGNGSYVEISRGNLLSREDCLAATKGASIIIHLATGGDRSFPDAYMNSVITTRNLLEAGMENQSMRRFVNISSFAVYSNTGKSPSDLLDESAPLEQRRDCGGDAYCFAKLKQDEMVKEYGEKFKVPYVIIRPGSVYGPGKAGITGRVGLGTFGIFLHLGGGNRVPFTYVDNCSDAIVLAGLSSGVDGEVFNVVDDDLPSSRQFLRLYKRNVRRFSSIYLPHSVSYGLCWLWEKYCDWSEGQLPPVFNRRRWNAEWRPTYYANKKLKQRVGWVPRVNMKEGLARYFEGCREQESNA